MNDMRIATPSGKSVPLYMVPQISAEGVNLGKFWSWRLVPAGIMIMTMTRKIIFSVEPTELKLAIQRVGMLLMKLWIIMMKVVRRKT